MVANRIRELREARGESQAGLSVRIGTTVFYLGLIELHGHLPGANLRARIAAALDVTEAEVWPVVEVK